jgi:hypothetical protein
MVLEQIRKVKISGVGAAAHSRRLRFRFQRSEKLAGVKRNSRALAIPEGSREPAGTTEACVLQGGVKGKVSTVDGWAFFPLTARRKVILECR